MGEVEIKGKNAEAFLQKVTTNDVSQLIDGSNWFVEKPNLARKNQLLLNQA
jgi:folate-binding Fe-S cluster repair protein YgfZ